MSEFQPPDKGGASLTAERIEELRREWGECWTPTDDEFHALLNMALASVTSSTRHIDVPVWFVEREGGEWWAGGSKPIDSTINWTRDPHCAVKYKTKAEADAASAYLKRHLYGDVFSTDHLFLDSTPPSAKPLEGERRDRLEIMTDLVAANKRIFDLERELAEAHKTLAAIYDQDTASPSATLESEEIAALRNRVEELQIGLAAASEASQLWEEGAKRAEANVLLVADNLPYLENLILPLGHEFALLRKHPAPCTGHDFCLMNQAQKGADAIRAALEGTLVAEGGKPPHPDTVRLDFLERKGINENWVARESSTGRGYRLHNSKDGTALSARAAIDQAMRELPSGPEGGK